MLGEALKAIMSGVQEVQDQKDLDAFAQEAARRFGSLGSKEGQDTARFVLENPRAAITYMEQMGGMGRWYDALKSDAEAKRTGSAVADILERPNYDRGAERSAQAEVLRSGGNPNIVPAAPQVQGISAYTYTPESIAEYERTNDPAVLKVNPWLSGQGKSEAKPNADLTNLPQGAKYLTLQKRRAALLAQEAKRRGITDPKKVAEFIQGDYEFQELSRQLESERASNGGTTPTQQSNDAEITEAWGFLEREMPSTTYREAVGVEQGFGLQNPKRPEIIQAVSKAQQKRLGESDAEYQKRLSKVRAWQTGSSSAASPGQPPKAGAAAAGAPPASAPARDPRAEVESFNEILRKKRSQ